MLWFVETGINGYRGLSIAALDVLRKCDIVYIERFTSSLSEVDIRELNSLLQMQTKPVKNSIKSAILHSASGIASIIGETGLHIYKFGRMVTMMSELSSAVSVYNT